MPSRNDPRVLPLVLARKQDSDVVCRSKKQKDNDSGKLKGSKRGDSKGKNNKRLFKSKCYKCGKIGHMSKECRSKETSAFEAGDKLAETGCTEMASIDWNVLEIGAVQLPEEDYRIRCGIDRVLR